MKSSPSNESSSQPMTPISSLPCDNIQREGDNEAESIQLPTLKYGYRTVPLDWPELIEILMVEKNIDRLSRSEHQQREYELYKHSLKSTWKSMNDFVLCSKFGLERRVDEQGLGFAHPPQAEVQGIIKRVLRNDFPYYMVPNVEHWILWKLGGDCTQDDIDQAKLEIQKQLGTTVEDFLHWVNPPHLKSLPEIDHVHILCLRNLDPSHL